MFMFAVNILLLNPAMKYFGQSVTEKIFWLCHFYFLFLLYIGILRELRRTLLCFVFDVTQTKHCYKSVQCPIVDIT